MNKFPSPNVLIVGCDSLIGRALAIHLYEQGHNIIETSRRQPSKKGRLYLDLSIPVSTYSLPGDISIAFICAAETQHKECRLYPERTRVVNVIQTEVLAKSLLATGARVIFLSSNSVYDGSKPYPRVEDPTRPFNEYGRQKAEAEKRLLALGKNVTVVRLTKVLTRQLPLIDGWIESLRMGSPIYPFTDITVPPLSLAFVVEMLSRLVNTSCSSIIQLSGSLDISYATLAQQVAVQLGVEPNLVHPIKSSEAGYNSVDKLPSNLTLDTTALQQFFQLKAPVLEEVVSAILKELAPTTIE